MKFRIYRYHLSPVSTESRDITINGEVETFTEQKLKESKNTFFETVLNSIDFYNNKRNILKIEFNDDNFFFFLLANKKQVSIVENFETKDIPTEPFVYILINNKNDIQKIAISYNSDAFSNPNVVKNILHKEFEKGLSKFGLTIKIEPMFQKETVWRMIGAHKNQLKSLEIKYIKPNLANISGSLPEAFRQFTEATNSQESAISMKAPTNGTLENIDKDNEALKGLIDYASEGAGNVKIGIKGYRKKVSTKDNPVEIEIDEAVFESDSKEIIHIIQKLFN